MTDRIHPCGSCNGTGRMVYDGEDLPCIFCGGKGGRRWIDKREAQTINDLQMDIHRADEALIRFATYLTKNHKMAERPSRWHWIERMKFDERYNLIAQLEQDNREYVDRWMIPELKDLRIR